MIKFNNDRVIKFAYVVLALLIGGWISMAENKQIAIEDSKNKLDKEQAIISHNKRLVEKQSKLKIKMLEELKQAVSGQDIKSINRLGADWYKLTGERFEKEIPALSSKIGEDYFTDASYEERRRDPNKSNFTSLEYQMLNFSEASKKIQLSAFRSLVNQYKEAVLYPDIQYISGRVIGRFKLKEPYCLNCAEAIVELDGKMVVIKYYEMTQKGMLSLARATSDTDAEIYASLSKIRSALQQSPQSQVYLQQLPIKATGRTVKTLKREYDEYSYCLLSDKDECKAYTDKNGRWFNEESNDSKNARKLVNTIERLIKSSQ